MIKDTDFYNFFVTHETVNKPEEISYVKCKNSVCSSSRHRYHFKTMTSYE